MKLAIFLILVLEATSIHFAEGWKRGLKRSGWLSCRGGSSSQPPNYDQGGYGGNFPPPDLPPDLPPLEGDGTQSAFEGQPQHQDPYSHQVDPLYGDSNEPTAPRDHQLYQVPPPLPPGYSNEQPPVGYGPPGMQEPPLYETNEESAMTDSWADTNNDSSGLDLSTFNKEYILKGLAKLYKKKILPLELSSRFGHFNSPPLSPSDFVAPPMVLLLGQYRYVVEMLHLAKPLLADILLTVVLVSVGKTSFIKYLLGRDFPGIRVGPEPTTDRFTAVLWGPNDKIVPGAALCSQQDRPFTGLSPFGNNFLSRLEGVELDSPVLYNVTLVDTPGILSGQKQRNRNYDYESVMKWFGERADLVIVMFDAHKLDISDELKRVMELFIPHIDKIRIVLNKADSISTQQLMRVYGALMWSLGKVLNTPEVCRVYMVSIRCTFICEEVQCISNTPVAPTGKLLGRAIAQLGTGRTITA